MSRTRHSGGLCRWRQITLQSTSMAKEGRKKAGNFMHVCYLLILIVVT